MSENPDRIVIDEHNGRPTLTLDAQPDGALLRWMLMGQTEPFTIWLETSLSDSEVEEFLDRAPRLIDRYLETLAPRAINVTMFGPGGDELAVTGIVNNPRVEITLFAMTALNAALEAEIKGYQVREKRAQAARSGLGAFAVA